jgi:hypothetical protein
MLIRVCCPPIALFVLAALAGLAIPALAVSPDAPTYWADDYKKLAEMGDGFVVWESHRSGAWRIYFSKLDGTGFRMLTPDEKDREHFCPHISPDGTRMVYISYPKDSDGYDHQPKNPGPLRIINMDGTGDRIIAATAVSYGEDRGAVWLNDNELVFIAGDAQSYRLNIATGQKARMVAEKQNPSDWCMGWLMDPTLHYATTGVPTFSLYEAGTKTIAPQTKQNGCQPYFTADGKWGFWMGDAGGPINRINLATRKFEPMIKKDDPQMPEGRRYLYFPMLSRCQRLFAFAASPNQHDHFKADYDIFIAPIDPATLKITSRPVRFTFDKECDRFPDVHLDDLPLGRHAGVAPLTLVFPSKGLPAGKVAWDFGDGQKQQGGQATHTYTRPGKFAVTASVGGKAYRGTVTVARGAAR